MGHPNPSRVDPQNENQFRDLVLWLEDQKIRCHKKLCSKTDNESYSMMYRHYSIDDRSSLRNPQSPAWPQIYNKYLKDLACPMVSFMKVYVNLYEEKLRYLAVGWKFFTGYWAVLLNLIMVNYFLLYERYNSVAHLQERLLKSTMTLITDSGAPA